MHGWSKSISKLKSLLFKSSGLTDVSNQHEKLTLVHGFEFLKVETLQQLKLQHMAIQVHAHTKILCILCYTVTFPAKHSTVVTAVTVLAQYSAAGASSGVGGPA